jgi:hypothetical protein
MATVIERHAAAFVNIVTIDPSAEHGSTNTMAWFQTVEDARIAAVAMITARGWHFTGDWDGKDHAEVRAAFLAGKFDGEIMWDNDDNHVGAVYASTLATPATVTRELLQF